MKKLFLSVLLAGFAFASVDINSASVKELTSLKGIGKKKAEAIVAYRKTRCFKNVNELTKVKGIGEKILKKIKKEITAGKCKRK